MFCWTTSSRHTSHIKEQNGITMDVSFHWKPVPFHHRIDACLAMSFVVILISYFVSVFVTIQNDRRVFYVFQSNHLVPYS